MASVVPEQLLLPAPPPFPADQQCYLLPATSLHCSSSSFPCSGELLLPSSPRRPVFVKRVPHCAPVRRIFSAMVACERHPNVMAFLGLVVSCRSWLLFVYEALQCDLLEALPRALCARQRLEYAVQCARGLAQFHGQGLVHGDVKPENYLLSTSGRVALGDFGLVKLASDPPDAHYVGTVVYSAPELMPGEGCAGRSAAADVWAFGCLLCVLLARRPTPFAAALEELGLDARHTTTATVSPLNGRAVSSEALQEWGVRLRQVHPATLAALGASAASSSSTTTTTPGCLPLILSCLALRPEDRPSMPAVLAQLLQLRQQLPVASLPPAHLAAVLGASGTSAEAAGECAEGVAAAVRAGAASALAAAGLPALLAQALRRHASLQGASTSLCEGLAALAAGQGALCVSEGAVAALTHALQLHVASARLCAAAGAALQALAAGGRAECRVVVGGGACAALQAAVRWHAEAVAGEGGSSSSAALEACSRALAAIEESSQQGEEQGAQAGAQATACCAVA